MEPDDLELRVVFDNYCSFDFHIWTKNFISIRSSWELHSNSSRILEDIVLHSGLNSLLRRELHYHELYDYYHAVSSRDVVDV